MTSLARALTNVSVDNCKARQKLDSIQKPKRRNREGGDKNFSTPEEEETGKEGGGGNAEGLTPPNLNWLHLELAVVRDCESAERVSNCQKKSSRSL